MRKQTNKRGKNPRKFKFQFVDEAKFIKEDGELIPNPRFGSKRRITHYNVVQPPKETV